MSSISPPLSDVLAPLDATHSNRIDWVDCAKGVGIVLVVYGHVTGGLVDSKVVVRGTWPETLAIFIYLFHMPLFFFVAGLWIDRALRKPFGLFLVDKVGVLLYPYLVWSCIQYTVNVAAAGFTNGSPGTVSGLFAIVYRPYAQFWFLYALFIVTVLGFSLAKVSRSVVLIIGILFHVASSFSGSDSLGVWGKAAESLIYFGAGHLMSPAIFRVTANLSRLQLLMSGMLAFGILGVVFLFERKPGVGTGLIAAFLGMSGIISWSVALAGGRLGTLVAWIGRYSLQIFVCHVLITAGLRIALLRVVGITRPEVHLLLGLIAGVAIPLAFAVAAERSHLTWIFTLRSPRLHQRLV